jgi:hypothetical protein
LLDLEQEMESGQLVQSFTFSGGKDPIPVPLGTKLSDCGDWEDTVGLVTQCGKQTGGGLRERVGVEILEGGEDLLAEVGHGEVRSLWAIVD